VGYSLQLGIVVQLAAWLFQPSNQFLPPSTRWNSSHLNNDNNLLSSSRQKKEGQTLIMLSLGCICLTLPSRHATADQKQEEKTFRICKIIVTPDVTVMDIS